ncbi:hypothetical protein NA57DRAFT_34640 [Rhizodiscina lignyota]|uniref:histidine kinase n=1 Tax=Rhizodiscina lignyota TaxID=1504668 RepID=A0A9P4ILL7_9PEZI|nr:hypothetical protein NA57DRAFT_34640 [Rhizodiscina lignyota]
MRAQLPPSPSPSQNQSPAVRQTRDAEKSGVHTSEKAPDAAERSATEQQPRSDTPTRYDSTRPSLQPNRGSGHVQTEMARDDSGADSDQNSLEEHEEGALGGDGVRDRRPDGSQKPSAEELRLERLREAVLLSQQRSKQGKTGGRQATSPGGSIASRRISPIKEEPPPGISPTLEDSFASPLTAGAKTASTESTESSARTIRGSMPPTPGIAALRTPSYPFPYVPGTPRTWSSNFHQPFTNLSPTVSSMNVRDVSTPQEHSVSGPSTPAASAATFLPGGGKASDQGSGDEQYPTPSLYDICLALNSEPGLDAWWAVVVNVLRDWYGAERATLAVPADSTELENVPWGQKATYNACGEDNVSPEAPMEKPRTAQHDLPLRKKDDSEKPFTSHLKSTPSARPNLVARHSYAGFERDRKDFSTPLEQPSGGRATRPRGPSRTVSHAPQTPSKADKREWDSSPTNPLTAPHPLRQLISQSPSDQEFSEVADKPEPSLREAVFPALRALDTEIDPLLDSAGVNKVLERAKLVTLTRDYTTNSSKAPSAEPSESENEKPQMRKHGASDDKKSGSRMLKAGKSQGDYFSRAKNPTTYEEYEQFPASPWAQSPAPSPAVQNDPEHNPFFTTSNAEEESFNPTETTPQNYAQFGQVEAIGVDRASTITHVPLIHPLLSHILPPLERRDSPIGGRKHRSDTTDTTLQMERRAPIAIVSFLSQTVPYPQNLTQSLKLLAPHLATTYSNANAYTNTFNQAVSIRHRRFTSNQRVGFAPLPSEPESLEDLLRIDIDDINASVSGSITSPSDYSAQSRPSPGGSLGGTPGWDPRSVFSNSVTNTPAHLPGSDSVDSYFDAKKRSSLTRSESGSGLAQKQRQAQAGKISPRLEQRSGSPPPPRLADLTSPRKSAIRLAPQSAERKQHTKLHSFGADFTASFNTLPASTAPIPIHRHSDASEQSNMRSPSLGDASDMLPPSERLLRLIIDSLPVQVFMAAPSDGSITWVNSKYLVYRGQDSRQIMQDPWRSIHADDLKEHIELWKRSLRTGSQLSHKVRLQRFDGQYRWFYVRAVPLKDKRQNIVHWIGTNMDFHEQHIAEMNAARQQETAASEAKYRALANSSPQIVFAVGRKHGVTFCNSQWVNYSGQSEEQARGLGFTEHVHPDDLEKCRLPSFDEDGQPGEVPVSMPTETSTPNMSRRESGREGSSKEGSSDEGSIDTSSLPQAKLSKLASTGILKVSRDAEGRPSYSTEVRLRSKDGKYRWHLVRVLLSDPVLQSDADDETWYGTCTDINDHKLLEQTLKETMDAKSRFLSNMSHEIRTPLNGITGMVNFLIDSNLTSEQMEHVSIIRSSTEGLRDLINDILDLSKVEAGMINLNMDWLHVRSLIEEVNDLTSAMAIDKGLDLNYVVEENVPPMVKGDRFRIRQVLLNVIGNAIKFTNAGEVFVRCQRIDGEGAASSQTEALVQFEVIDTGSGFTEKEAEYLFKRFSQIDGSSTRQHGGTGLGLAISMQLVELHGGRMKASSVPGKGSNFTFTIKFSLPSEEDRPPLPPPTPGLVAPVTRPASVATTPALMSPTPQSLLRQTLATHAKEMTESPGSYSYSPGADRHTSVSSGSSAPSTRSGKTSSHSERSSVSSYLPEALSVQGEGTTMPLRMPGERMDSYESQSKGSDNSADTDETLRPPGTLSEPPSRQTVSPLSSLSPVPPPLFSILVVCPLQWSREATVKHIEMTMPKTTPHNITARENHEEALEMLSGADPVLFTHVVLSVHVPNQVVQFMDLLFRLPGKDDDPALPLSTVQSNTQLVVITDLAQKRAVAELAPKYNYDELQREKRLRYVFKPLKPSKFAVIFDPQKEREMSTDRSLEGAQAVAVSQKHVFDEMKRRLGEKGIKVLLVEDNKTNQMVLLKFLGKAGLEVDAVMDGVQCTDKVFGSPAGTYSIILCDLHMPNKDGYQTCKDIRKWERKHHYQRLPIIALSANVLGDVYAKCVEAGFNSYVTKPVDFKELSEAMTAFLDPEVPGKAPPFMRLKDEMSKRTLR